MFPDARRAFRAPKNMNEIKFSSESFKRAMAKAVEKKPLVRNGKTAGEYVVAASDGFSSYRVLFQIGANGRRLSSCLCAGGRKGFFCYHQAAALLAHTAFVRAGLRAGAVSRRAVVDASRVWSGSDAMRALV